MQSKRNIATVWHRAFSKSWMLQIWCCMQTKQTAAPENIGVFCSSQLCKMWGCGRGCELSARIILLKMCSIFSSVLNWLNKGRLFLPRNCAIPTPVAHQSFYFSPVMAVVARRCHSPLGNAGRHRMGDLVPHRALTAFRTSQNLGLHNDELEDSLLINNLNSIFSSSDK